ncbi:hypothetical protein BDV96DRAFT_16539 [Lophiotrema nucula]|uniref:Uncharacterized protein n=1 Tax=Lophiotrema nucula TaxID=690887 RepID=A0A6A5ZCQ0_9PLEO|nr:hypothetical protein BDV96DRAFT_16539 [Lophiotrema nucula]
MHYSQAIALALAAFPLISAAPTHLHLSKKWVDTNGGFSPDRIPAHFVASVRDFHARAAEAEKALAREAISKRQLDQLLGGLTGGGAAGGAAPLAGLLGGGAGADPLAALLGGATKGKGKGKANAGAANAGTATAGAAKGKTSTAATAGTSAAAGKSKGKTNGAGAAGAATNGTATAGIIARLLYDYALI